MALTGTEPVSAANLKSLMDSGAMGGGCPLQRGDDV